MPIYEYECTRCKKSFDAEQRITEPPLEKCPAKDCNGEVQRLISGGTSFTLKGGGWFKDGY